MTSSWGYDVLGHHSHETLYQLSYFPKLHNKNIVFQCDALLNIRELRLLSNYSVLPEKALPYHVGSRITLLREEVERHSSYYAIF